MRASKTLVRISYALARLKREGVLWGIRKLAGRALLWFAWTGLLPITCVGHILGYRRVPVLTNRIGHLAAEVDCFLKLLQLGQIRRDGRHYFIVAIKGRTANQCLIRYWSKFLPVIGNRWLGLILELMTLGPLMKHPIHDYVLGIGCSAKYGSVNAAWGTRPPILSLDLQHQKQGSDSLRAMGIPEGAWYVCVHAREAGYSPEDESVHDYRNVNIESMLPAMHAIVAKGGWCIRIGDPSMTRLPKMPGIIDYAHHPIRSSEMDVYLAATAKFFLGNTSGIFLLSSIFGVPSALSNMVPISSRGFLPTDLNIFKLVRDKSSGRYLTMREQAMSVIFNYRMSSVYVEAGLECVENSPEDILGLVEEMFERLDRTFEENGGEFSLSESFNDLFRPGDYSYGTLSKVATTFVRGHRELFI